MSSTMLSQLRKFLKPFTEKVSEDEPPLAPGTSSSLPTVSVRKEFVKGDCPNMKLFVVPDLEKDLGIELDEDDAVRPLILKFSDLLEALQATKEMALLGEKWGYRNANMELDGWQQHKLLPIMLWVTAMSLDPDSDIRVLTMSAEKDFNFLSNVVSFTAPGVNVASLNLAAHGEFDPIQHCKIPTAGDLDA
ncbi:hypothetical protein QL093DRAFT_2104042 [Fusarium oxysporum]|nr:hypothetical protein QL093DRAFT_2104042 [Fusarium oxysporum]